MGNVGIIHLGWIVFQPRVKSRKRRGTRVIVVKQEIFENSPITRKIVMTHKRDERGEVIDTSTTVEESVVNR